MEGTRIIPDLQCSLLCEDVRQEASGSFVLVGVLGALRVAKLPVQAYKLCVFSRWTAGVGEFVEEVRLLDPDQSTVLKKSQVKFRLNDPSAHATNANLFPQVQFTKEGVYYVEVMVDQIMKLRFPVPVKVVQPAQPPTATEGQPPADNPPA